MLADVTRSAAAASSSSSRKEHAMKGMRRADFIRLYIDRLLKFSPAERGLASGGAAAQSQNVHADAACCRPLLLLLLQRSAALCAEFRCCRSCCVGCAPPCNDGLIPPKKDNSSGQGDRFKNSHTSDKVDSPKDGVASLCCFRCAASTTAATHTRWSHRLVFDTIVAQRQGVVDASVSQQ